MANHLRTFEEVVAAQDPAERERRERDEHYRDRAVEQRAFAAKAAFGHNGPVCR